MLNGFERGAFKALADALGVAGKKGVFGADLEHVVAKAVACAQQKHGFVLELAGGHAGQRGQRMRFGHGGQERLVVQGRDGQARVRERLGQDGAVDIARAQHLQQAHGEGFLQQQGHLRREANVLLHQIGQQVGADGGNDAELERTAQGVFAALGDFAHPVSLLQHALGLAHDFFAQRGDGDFSRAALENFDVQLFFQLSDGNR